MSTASDAIRTAPTDTETTVTVLAWHDPAVEAMPGACPTASDDALVWYTPSIGPTGMLLAHRLAAYAADGPTQWTLPDLARTFGHGGSVSRITHILDRLERFGIIARHDDSVAVRLVLAPLTRRQRAGLPAYLAAAYPH